MTKTSNKSEPATPSPASRTQAADSFVTGGISESQQQGVTQEDIYSVPVKRKGLFLFSLILLLLHISRQICFTVSRLII